MQGFEILGFLGLRGGGGGAVESSAGFLASELSCLLLGLRARGLQVRGRYIETVGFSLRPGKPGKGVGIQGCSSSFMFFVLLYACGLL